MTRAEKVIEAQRLRAEGLKLREIGERMGVPLKTAHGWLSDPDLSKQRARRKRYAGRCVDCDAPTDGSSGPGKSAVRCKPCSTERFVKRNAERTDAYRALVERLWSEGKTAREIGAAVGWAGKFMDANISVLRAHGYNLPYRNLGSLAFAREHGASRMAIARAARKDRAA